MGIHYDYKSTKSAKLMEKQAKREKKLAEKKASNGIYISGKKIISVIDGISEFWSITFSNPLPIETAKKIWGIIPIRVARKKLLVLTSKIVGKIQLSCQGIPPINL